MAPGLINFRLHESSRHFKESVIVIIDYQAGNLTSVVRSLKALGVEGTVTQDPLVVARATRVIFPGVGAAGKAMATLRELGLDQALRQSFARGVPILGICLGAQIRDAVEKISKLHTPGHGSIKFIAEKRGRPL